MDQNDAMLRASLAGAVDLSALKNRSQSQPGQSPEGQAGASVVSASFNDGDPSQSNFEVASVVSDLTTANLRTFMAISNSVPVIVEFYTSRSEPSRELSVKLAKLIRAAEGRLLLGRADADSSADLVQAFGVSALPSVHAILKGQPIALFTADQPESAIAEVLQKVLMAANQNGLNGRVTETEAQAAGDDTVPVSPKHKAGMDALNAGDLLTAEKEFAQVLAESPADVVAAEALAQIRLQIRLEPVDIEATLAGKADTLEQALTLADVLLVTGAVEQAFDSLLDRFAKNFAERDVIKARLLELFTAIGGGEAVTNARKKLTMLLY